MAKTYTIFYSWQSDTKDKSDSLIESALSFAKDYLKENYGIQIVVDQSTLGKSGMPSIDQTILQKIDNCDIFLCDLTPVTTYEKQEGNGLTVKKEVPNPNVLLELGYAMSAVGVDYIIPVAHQGKWLPANMPFDINHHALYCFTKDSCNLSTSILKVIEYIKKNGPHRHQEEPFWYHRLSVFFYSLRERFFTKKFDPYKDAITEHSTVFFKRRMCAAFPGERGLVEYTDQKKIKRALEKLLEKPLKFKKSIGRDSRKDPIWWFRAGSAMEIDKFRYLGNGRYLIGWDEVKIKRLVAFIDNGMYYSNYVYLEFDADEPSGVYGDYYNPEHNKELSRDHHHITEEYAIFKPYWFYQKKITKMEEDDGHTTILGRTVALKRRYECRIRSLTPYNFIIAAKQSSFNNRIFDSTSGDVMDAMLDGSITKEQMHDYMLKFPKPQD